MTAPVRFRFAEFTLSPRQRLLTRGGIPVPLIPKYLDLLKLLVERRRDAVSKQAIFDCIWADVVVSDGALSQAVRTLRRTLGDDSREPRFIRTVSRHGYQFVWAEVIEEADEGPLGETGAPAAAAENPASVPAGDRSTVAGVTDAIDPLVSQLLAATAAQGDRMDEERAREAAERLHALDTAKATASLVSQPGHASALAVLRDARWTVAGAGEVPLFADREAPATIVALVRLRLAQMKRTVARRWAGAAAAGMAGGIFAGLAGGIALYLAPDSQALPESALALGAIGAAAGGLGAAGIGAGLAATEVLARSRRGLALALGGAVAGALVAAMAHLLLHAILDGLFGFRMAYDQFRLGGTIDGLFLGGAAGCGYALATRQPPGGGLAAPAGARRALVALQVGLWCACAAAILAASGRLLVGGLVHEIARSSHNAQLVLGPLGRLIGEPGFGTMTRTLLSALEGGTFGASLAWGLTRRPSPVGGPAS